MEGSGRSVERSPNSEVKAVALEAETGLHNQVGGESGFEQELGASEFHAQDWHYSDTTDLNGNEVWTWAFRGR